MASLGIDDHDEGEEEDEEGVPLEQVQVPQNVQHAQRTCRHKHTAQLISEGREEGGGRRREEGGGGRGREEDGRREEG